MPDQERDRVNASMERASVSIFRNPTNGDEVMLEDDGRVAYAYFLRGGKIEGDVWLYNRLPAPVEPPWIAPRREEPPFLNPRDFVVESAEPFDLNSVELLLRPDEAAIYVHGRLHAIVGVGEKPGKSTYAAKDGPLAKGLK